MAKQCRVRKLTTIFPDFMSPPGTTLLNWLSHISRLAALGTLLDIPQVLFRTTFSSPGFTVFPTRVSIPDLNGAAGFVDFGWYFCILTSLDGVNGYLDEELLCRYPLDSFGRDVGPLLSLVIPLKASPISSWKQSIFLYKYIFFLKCAKFTAGVLRACQLWSREMTKL